jgi:hypothetical protein
MRYCQSLMQIVEALGRKSRTFLPSSRAAEILSASGTDKPTIQVYYKQILPILQQVLEMLSVVMNVFLAPTLITGGIFIMCCNLGSI